MTDDIIALLDNPEFNLWILFPDDASNQYWEKVADESSRNSESIKKARLIFAALDKEFKVDFPEPETINLMLRRILDAK